MPKYGNLMGSFKLTLTLDTLLDSRCWLQKRVTTPNIEAYFFTFNFMRIAI